MRRARMIRVLAGLLLAVFGSVMMTLPIHLSSVDHIDGTCTPAASSSGGVGCLFVHFLSESYAEGEGTPSLQAPTPCELIPEIWSSSFCSITVPALPALRAPPFLSIA